ncbi:MAG: transglycosylase domain-containing protein [Sulfuriferula sp.]
MYRYACFCLIYLLSAASYAANVPSFTKIRAQYTSSVIDLLDRNGTVLNQQLIHPQQQRLSWVSLNELSPALLNALLVSEDQRFYQHQGVDWRAIAGAAWENLIHNTHRGASTLTMQLAGLLDPSLSRGTGGRTYGQKWRQIKAAQQLEKHWSKAQILEAYLNLVDFRANIIGIHAASNALFDTTPTHITTTQASILAALLRGPNAPADIVAQRACGVAFQLTHSHTPCADIQKTSLSKLGTSPKLNLHPQIAPEVAQQLLANSHQNVLSSLDYGLQVKLIQQLSQTSSTAAVILDNKTAEILAYVNTDSATNQVVAPHDNGVALFPYIYATAINQKQLTAASLFDNTPLIFNTELSVYAPNPPSRDWVSVRTALSNALALPTQQVLTQLDHTKWNQQLQSLKLNPSSNTLLALANAYQMLANHGLYYPASFHPGGIGLPTRVYSDTTSSVINDILTPNRDGTSYFTLISDNNWAIGADPHYTIALWSEKSDDIRDLWLQIDEALTLNTPSYPPKLSNKLIRQAVQFEADVEPPRTELFLPNTATSFIAIPASINTTLIPNIVSNTSANIK